MNTALTPLIAQAGQADIARGARHRSRVAELRRARRDRRAARRGSPDRDGILWTWRHASPAPDS